LHALTASLIQPVKVRKKVVVKNDIFFKLARHVPYGVLISIYMIYLEIIK